MDTKRVYTKRVYTKRVYTKRVYTKRVYTKRVYIKRVYTSRVYYPTPLGRDLSQKVMRTFQGVDKVRPSSSLLLLLLFTLALALAFVFALVPTLAFAVALSFPQPDTEEVMVYLLTSDIVIVIPHCRGIPPYCDPVTRCTACYTLMGLLLMGHLGHL